MRVALMPKLFVTRRWLTMPEQKIVITIDQEGAISAKTSGFKGESCLEALDALLEIDEKGVQSFKKTDEYHQKQTIQTNQTIQIGRKSK